MNLYKSDWVEEEMAIEDNSLAEDYIKEEQLPNK
jgi:hypothetical protein